MGIKKCIEKCLPKHKFILTPFEQKGRDTLIKFSISLDVPVSITLLPSHAVKRRVASNIASRRPHIFCVSKFCESLRKVNLSLASGGRSKDGLIWVWNGFPMTFFLSSPSSPCFELFFVCFLDPLFFLEPFFLQCFLF